MCILLSSLSFLVKLMLGTNIIELLQLKLDVFTQLEPCQKLNHQLEGRGLGASRIYTLFLLIKKSVWQCSLSPCLHSARAVPVLTMAALIVLLQCR